MIISTKGRYALKIMLYLALHADEGFVSLRKISESEDISVKYLEAIVAMLNRAGMVESQRGKEGGYRLTKSAGEYTVGSIVKLTEGSISPVSCIECESGSCENAGSCLTLPVWINLDRLVDNYLESITLLDLIERKVEY